MMSVGGHFLKFTLVDILHGKNQQESVKKTEKFMDQNFLWLLLKITRFDAIFKLLKLF